MSTLRIKAPDGKTLAVNVADGTDPSQYDGIVDDVMKDYVSKNHAQVTPGLVMKMMGAVTTPANKAEEVLNDAGEAAAEKGGEVGFPKTGAAIGTGLQMIKPATEAASMYEPSVDLANGVVKGITSLGQKAGSTVGNAWDAITGNTPRGFGYAQGAGATPEARALAKESISMANEPQEELGKLVNRSQAPANALPPEGGEAAIPAPEEFQTPIRQGILSGKEEMMHAAEAQRDQVGGAIKSVLGKYDATGTFYDPTAYNEQIKSMLLRDATGDVMTTGAQGQINEAIKEAGSSMADFSKGSPIKWSDAAQVKTLLQGNGKWGQAGLSRAQDAYNTAATLLKEDIDKQAMEMLQKQGGNVQDYQQLRDAYAKLSSLSDSLNVAAKRQFANSAIPWWVKMAGGSLLAGKAMGVVKGLTGH